MSQCIYCDTVCVCVCVCVCGLLVLTMAWSEALIIYTTTKYFTRSHTADNESLDVDRPR